LTTLLLLTAAHASVTYPGDVEADAGMPCAPQCVLCHESNTGGAGTVTMPFGAALMDRGLLGGGQSDLLGAALDALDADAVDSDGDGTPDLDELAAGDDPNGGPAFCGADVVAPQYGCFDQAQAGAGLVAALVAALAARRRR
jgi:hypothetical protein